MFMRLLRSSLISFSNVLLFSVDKSFNSWVRLIPKHFIILVAFINEIDVLFYFGDCSLLVWRNTVDFCVLILSPETAEFVD